MHMRIGVSPWQLAKRLHCSRLRRWAAGLDDKCEQWPYPPSLRDPPLRVGVVARQLGKCRRCLDGGVEVAAVEQRE